jgi:hypothetical protein
MKKIEPYTPEWERLANQVARDFAPTIYPCADCGRPVANGYCCTHCGSNDPRTSSKPNNQPHGRGLPRPSGGAG